MAQVSALDVAEYILSKTHGPMPAVKLHKLVYYSHAWSLVWDDAALIRERIEAWVLGPVIPRLYAAHRGKFELVAGEIGGDHKALSQKQRDTVDAVMKHYGKFTAQGLVELSHNEKPWLTARKGLEPSARGNTEIKNAAMHEFYLGLATSKKR